MDRLVREGGVEFIQFLLAKALADNGEPLQSTPREWTFRDILRMPDAERKEWFAACKEEIEALVKRGVIELVPLPPGRKTVKCRFNWPWSRLVPCMWIGISNPVIGKAVKVAGLAISTGS